MRVLTEAEFEEIMSKDSDVHWEGDNALIGLNIIAKYMPKNSEIIGGAGHDIIYSVDVDDLLNGGLTREDAETLRKINWMIHEEHFLACYV